MEFDRRDNTAITKRINELEDKVFFKLDELKADDDAIDRKLILLAYQVGAIVIAIKWFLTVVGSVLIVAIVKTILTK